MAAQPSKRSGNNGLLVGISEGDINMNTFFILFFSIPVWITFGVFLPDNLEWWQAISVGSTSALISMAAMNSSGN